jgi:erythronate-4-phosphate dehydrogenase
LTPRILADENIPAVEHYLGHYGNVQRVNGRTLQRSQLQDVDVLLVRSVTRVGETLLAGTPVKFVGSATSGIDHIDRDYLEKQGIAFAYAPASNANSVVEYVLSAIAAVGDSLERLFSGGVVGIVGYGCVGRALAARLKALDIPYRVYDPWLDQGLICQPAGLAEVLSCDVVSLHPELTDEQPWPSHHLISSAQLKTLRPETLLINASRGPVLDNEALLAHLGQGQGPLTVLDVWEPEPNISASLLQHVVLGTPHIAGYSLDGKVDATRMLSDAVATSLQLPPLLGEPPVSPPAQLIVPQSLVGTDLVRFLLHARYDIARDDAVLRKVILEESNDSGAGFDNLRKSYGERRELAGSTVACVNGRVDSRALIQALGCEFSPEGER